jgi:O-antigen/teichoic acid export membrane protein
VDQIIKMIKNLLGFGEGHERTKRAKKNIIGSFAVKGLSILIGLVLTPMTIHYINPTRYGIWLTLSSIIAWFGFFDIGFGNGMRNKFAEAVAQGNKELARIYVSTTYAILSIIIGIVLALFLVINPFLNWTKILNTSPEMAQELSVLAMIVFTFFCLQFVFKLITTVLLADQKPAKSSFFNLLGSIFSLIAIFILTKTTHGSLIYLGLALGFSPIFVLLCSSFWYYFRDYKYYRPSIKYVHFKYAKNLMNLGIKFFIIQVATIFLYQTNNLIITQLFGPSEVTTYNIAFQYFSVIPMAFTIITAPFWSAYTEAFVKNDIQWIRKTIKTLIIIWGLFFLASVVMLACSNVVYLLWIGKSVKVPFILSMVCAIYGIIVTWSNIFLTFINGVGKIALQVSLTIIVIFINIPLAIFLAKYMKFGVSGVLLATSIDFMMFAMVMAIQYRKIINNKARGIWNR